MHFSQSAKHVDLEEVVERKARVVGIRNSYHRLVSSTDALTTRVRHPGDPNADSRRRHTGGAARVHTGVAWQISGVRAAIETGTSRAVPTHHGDLHSQEDFS